MMLNRELNVARFLLEILSRSPPNTVVQLEEVNGQPAIVIYIDEQLYGVFSLDVINEHIQGIYITLSSQSQRRKL